MSNNSLPQPVAIAASATAVPAFVGYTRLTGTSTIDLTLTPVWITSMAMYTAHFGLPAGEQFMEVLLTSDAAGNTLVTAQFAAGKTASPYNMYYALQLFFANGGTGCYVVSTGVAVAGGTVSVAPLQKGLDALQQAPATLVIFPEAVQALSTADYSTLITAALQHCSTTNCFAILDVTCNSMQTTAANAAAFRSLVNASPDLLCYGAAYFPYIHTTISYVYNEAEITVTDKRSTPAVVTSLPALQASSNALYQQAKHALDLCTVCLPPAAAVAGAYVFTDTSKGVWKAPANVAVNGVSGPVVNITDADNEMLTVDAVAGASINALRFFTGRGLLIWGARTLTGNNNEWRYVPVRRLANMVEASVLAGIAQFKTFPNNSTTWTSIVSLIQPFLTGLWRQGALMGAKPQEAFYVKTGLGGTMTATDVLEGRLVVSIGIAPVRAAEFIIINISQLMMP